MGEGTTQGEAVPLAVAAAGWGDWDVGHDTGRFGRMCWGVSFGVECTGVALGGVRVPNVPSPGVCILLAASFWVDFFVSVLPGVDATGWGSDDGRCS